MVKFPSCSVKEIKVGKSNDDNLESAHLQDDELLMHLRATDGHATCNVIKKVLLVHAQGDHH